MDSTSFAIAVQSFILATSITSFIAVWIGKLWE
jgi:hypothetical protein